MLAPLSRSARFRDQLGLDDEVNSQIADGGDMGTCRPHVTSVGDLPTSSASAVQLILEYMCSARTPPVDTSVKCVNGEKLKKKTLIYYNLSMTVAKACEYQ